MHLVLGTARAPTAAYLDCQLCTQPHRAFTVICVSVNELWRRQWPLCPIFGDLGGVV